MSDNGGGEYSLRGSGKSVAGGYFYAQVAKAPPDMPEAIRREALEIAMKFDGMSVCQTIQNADLIAQWLHAGRVPQV